MGLLAIAKTFWIGVLRWSETQVSKQFSILAEGHCWRQKATVYKFKLYELQKEDLDFICFNAQARGRIGRQFNTFVKLPLSWTCVYNKRTEALFTLVSESSVISWLEPLDVRS